MLLLLIPLQNGLPLYRDKVLLSSASPLKPLVLQHAHNSPLGGHSGYLKTMHRIQHDFFWFGMKHDIKHHIKTCETCQQIKVDTSKLVGLLQPLPFPNKPWLDISMDFVDKHSEISRLNVSGVNDQRALESPEKADAKSEATREDQPRILRW